MFKVIVVCISRVTMDSVFHIEPDAYTVITQTGAVGTSPTFIIVVRKLKSALVLTVNNI